jgi:uncharacterized membrane protein YtjA (UPF0391 family)
MVQYAIVFFATAITAALLGFSGIAAGAAGIAKTLFVVFLIGAIVTLGMGFGRRSRLPRRVEPIPRIRERIN